MRFSLPLVGKELEEQASRKRTYHVRLGYALILMGTFYTIYADVVGAGGDALTALGQGLRLYTPLVGILFAYVVFVVPAFSSGAVNSERKTGSLDLLRLTTLGPGSIVIEKFVGRLIPVLCNLAIALPVLLLTYTFGGVALAKLCHAATALVVTAILVSAISLDMSAILDTAEGAFGATIGVIAALTVTALGLTSLLPGQAHWWLALSPPAAVWEFDIVGGGAASTAILVVTAFAISAIFLWDAIRRLRGLADTETLAAPEPVVERVLRSIAAGKLPVSRPIAWRERHRRWIGRPRFAAVFVGIVAVLALLGARLAGNITYWDRFALLLLSGLWLGGLLISVAGTVGAISNERVDKTFEVLMTTPLTGREILRDKMIGVQRFQWTLLLVVLVCLFAFSMSTLLVQPPPALFYGALAVGLVVDLGMLCWLAVFVGLRVRQANRASVIALLIIFGICVVPLVIGPQFSGILWLARFVSPVAFFYDAFMPLWTANWGGFHAAEVGAVAGLHAAVWLLLSSHCIKHADRYLGRVEFDWWSRQRRTSPF